MFSCALCCLCLEFFVTSMALEGLLWGYYFPLVILATGYIQQGN